MWSRMSEMKDIRFGGRQWRARSVDGSSKGRYRMRKELLIQLHCVHVDGSAPTKGLKSRTMRGSLACWEFVWLQKLRWSVRSDLDALLDGGGQWMIACDRKPRLVESTRVSTRTASGPEPLSKAAEKIRAVESTQLIVIQCKLLFFEPSWMRYSSPKICACVQMKSQSVLPRLHHQHIGIVSAPSSVE